MVYIFKDLNVRLSDVNTSDVLTITDSRVIHQSLEKLVNTPMGSIYNYRDYGLNLRQFSQYPLSEVTGNLIFDHIEIQIKNFITTVNILDNLTTMELDPDNSLISITIAVQSKSTGEVIILPPINVPVSL